MNTIKKLSLLHNICIVFVLFEYAQEENLSLSPFPFPLPCLVFYLVQYYDGKDGQEGHIGSNGRLMMFRRGRVRLRIEGFGEVDMVW